MAHLFKPQIVRWNDPDGKRCKANAPGAKRSVEQAAKWYAKGLPGWPKGKKVPLATHKRVAEKMLSDLLVAAERGMAGLPAADLNRAKL